MTITEAGWTFTIPPVYNRSWSKRTVPPADRKTVDEVAVIRCEAGEGLLREEVWEDVNGSVVRYNLAFINFALFAGDNGRVLGYDTAHGAPHRHFAGSVTPIESLDYSEILERFIAEVSELRTRKVL